MIFIILGAIGILFLLLFYYSACSLSSRNSREEEKYEHIRNVQEIVKRR